MDIALIMTIVNYLGATAASLTTNAAIQTAIELLEKWLPVILQEAEDLVPQVQEFISILAGSPNLSADQMSALQTLSDQADAALNAAIANATSVAATSGSAA